MAPSVFQIIHLHGGNQGVRGRKLRPSAGMRGPVAGISHIYIGIIHIYVFLRNTYFYLHIEGTPKWAAYWLLQITDIGSFGGTIISRKERLQLSQAVTMRQKHRETHVGSPNVNHESKHIQQWTIIYVCDWSPGVIVWFRNTWCWAFFLGLYCCWRCWEYLL